MRRFTCKYDKQYHFKEWPSKKVDDERKAAEKHEYAQGMAEAFVKIQGERTISKY